MSVEVTEGSFDGEVGSEWTGVHVSKELTKLAESSKGRTDRARLREVIESVEKAFEAGASHADVMGVLNRNGCEFTPKGFAKALYVVRKERTATTRKAG